MLCLLPLQRNESCSRKTLFFRHGLSGLQMLMLMQPATLCERHKMGLRSASFLSLIQYVVQQLTYIIDLGVLPVLSQLEGGHLLALFLVSTNS